MDSDTGLTGILGTLGSLGSSYFDSESKTNALKLNSKQQLALAGQQANAQKTVLMLAIGGAVIVALIVVVSMFRKR